MNAQQHQLSPAQTTTLARMRRGLSVRVKELLELEAMGLTHRKIATPASYSDWELTAEGQALADEISF